MKSIKGSAIYNDDGTYIFTPYDEGKPENVNWLPLATVENGKLECSKKKVRMVLTCDRMDLGQVVSVFTKAFGRLAARTIDSRVKKLFRASAEKRPHELKNMLKNTPSDFVNQEEEDEIIPTHGY